MTFSTSPDIVEIEGETLEQKIRFIEDADWGGSTNIEATFDLILETAVDNHVKPEEMPEALVIVTDMEFNDMLYYENVDSFGFYDEMVARFDKAGYKIPHLVFWNVSSRHETFHASSDCAGVTLVSGHSTSTFKTVIKSLSMTPTEMMLETLNSERYSPITISE